ncbi:MAG TPA: hypothetical protein PL137_26110, partial [Nocardioides sp.]|nr:hypothetical protein [Nocardioides sp.]
PVTRQLLPHARLPHGLRLSSGAERTKGRGSWASLRGDTEAFTTTWTYDIRGQLDVVEHPNTTEEEHLYDRAGRLRGWRA